MNQHRKHEMATEEKAAFSHWIVENIEAIKVFLTKSTWLLISIFAVSTRLAMDRIKGVKIGSIQKLCAYVIGVFIGYLSYNASIVLGCEDERLRIIIVGCSSISFNEISKTLIGLKWRNIIENLIKAYDSTKRK